MVESKPPHIVFIVADDLGKSRIQIENNRK